MRLAARLWRRLRVLVRASNYDDPRGPRYAGDHARRPPSHDGIVAVTFNLKYGVEVDAAIRALSTPPLAVADVLLMQEVDARATGAIARGLGLRYVYYPGSVHTNGRDFGNAVLTPWPVLSDRKLPVPHTDLHDGRRRPGTVAIIDVAGRAVATYSMHTAVPPLSIGKRLEQAAPAFEDAVATGLPALIGGDFNTREPEAVAALQALAARHGFVVASAGVTTTSDRGLLDHLFARGLEPREAGTHDGPAGSDHRPVWARL